MGAATMPPAAWPRDTGVRVCPFTSRRAADSDEVIVTSTDGLIALAISPEAFAVLEALACGRSVQETAMDYEAVHGVCPDIDAFLDELSRHGFVSAVGQSAAVGGQRTPRGRLTFGLSATVARRFVSAPVLAGCAALIGLALLLVVLDPRVVPGPTALVFPRASAVLLIPLLAFGFVTVALHELAHAVAARAAGAAPRIGMGNRLWYPVAETDMTGLWLASRRQRCLAFLAGPLLDAASAALLIVLLEAVRHDWLSMNVAAVHFVRACLVTYLVRLLWQCFFFVRTDFYYVVACLFDCKNLLGDTETLILSVAARYVPRLRRRQPALIPAHELRVVRVYALLWLVGRTAAFASLFLGLPVLAGYVRLLGTDLTQLDRLNAQTASSMIAVTMALAAQIVGLALWLRGLAMTRWPTARRGP